MKFKITSCFLIFFTNFVFATGYNATDAASGFVSIIFNDVTVIRRSPEFDPVIGREREDFSIKIACLGMSYCCSKILNMYKILTKKSPSQVLCDLPIYAKITVFYAATAYGESKKDDVFEIDYSGKCLVYEGQTYKLKKSIFEILNGRSALKF